MSSVKNQSTTTTLESNIVISVHQQLIRYARKISAAKVESHADLQRSEATSVLKAIKESANYAGSGFRGTHHHVTTASSKLRGPLPATREDERRPRSTGVTHAVQGRRLASDIVYACPPPLLKPTTRSAHNQPNALASLANL
ncbi:hypothetical protein MRX96_027093 [Rhipicephalus microplus]